MLLMGKSPFLMGKSPFLMAKSTISTGPFSSSQTVCLPEGTCNKIQKWYVVDIAEMRKRDHQRQQTKDY